MRLSFHQLTEYRDMVNENKDLMDWRESLAQPKGIAYDRDRVQTSTSSTGVEPIVEERERILQIVKNRTVENEAQLARIAEFIEEEKNPRIRLYMRKFFIQGWTWTQIAEHYNVDRSYIAKQVKDAVESRY